MWDAIGDALKGFLSGGFYAYKRRLVRFFFELAFISLSLLAVLVGAVLLLVQFLPLWMLALVFIVGGLSFFSLALLLLKIS